jgi:hypothetical protein
MGSFLWVLSLKNRLQHCTQMVKETHQCQQQLVHLQHQNAFKRKKTIQLGQKLKCADSPKEARAQCAVCAGQHNPQHVHNVQNARLCMRKSMHFYE